MKRKSVIGSLCCLLILSLSACGNSGVKNTEAGAEDKDSLVCYVGHGFWESSLDPVKGGFSYGWSFINNALLKVQPDSTYGGDLAESFHISEDALTYTFLLKEGITFHDGSELTAEDVVFTYETVKENQGNNEKVDLSKMAFIEAEDERTVKITLSEPYSPFLDMTAQLGIVPSDGYDSDAFNELPVGTGPFKAVQYDEGQQFLVEANEDYFDGAPKIKKAAFVNMDNEAAFSNARSGQLDIVMVQPNYAGEEIPGMHVEKLETMDVRNISLPCRPLQTVEAPDGEEVLAGNDVTSDKAVREALNIGIDRKKIIEHAFNGVGVPAYGFTDNLEWGNAPEITDCLKEEAEALLLEAGWKDTDGDGIREKGDLRCSFEVYTPSDEQDRYQLAAALAEEAGELGIEIQVKQTTWDEITKASYSSGVVWGFGQFNPMVIHQLFSSETFLTAQYSNTPGYENPQVDAGIREAIESADHEKAVEKWKEVQEVYAEEIPYLYLVNIEHCYFVNDRVDISVSTQVPHPHGHGIPIICNMKDWTFK
ncbi:MAG: ABC transporter substrate-binding protein [Lachnospiraceae bacterium]